MVQNSCRAEDVIYEGHNGIRTRMEEVSRWEIPSHFCNMKKDGGELAGAAARGSQLSHWHTQGGPAGGWGLRVQVEPYNSHSEQVGTWGTAVRREDTTSEVILTLLPPGGPLYQSVGRVPPFAPGQTVQQDTLTGESLKVTTVVWALERSPSVRSRQDCSSQEPILLTENTKTS